MLGRHMLLDAENVREPANWSMPVEPLTSPFPFLLGIEENDCFGSKLKVNDDPLLVLLAQSPDVFDDYICRSVSRWYS